MRWPRKDFRTCLLCNYPAGGRGLCTVHYARARRAVLRGGLSWESLEGIGRALPLVEMRERAVTRGEGDG